MIVDNEKMTVIVWLRARDGSLQLILTYPLSPKVVYVGHVHLNYEILKYHWGRRLNGRRGSDRGNEIAKRFRVRNTAAPQQPQDSAKALRILKLVLVGSESQTSAVSKSFQLRPRSTHPPHPSLPVSIKQIPSRWLLCTISPVARSRPTG